jgi:hypothetical protein
VNTEKLRYFVTLKSDKEWEIFDTEFLTIEHFEMRLSLNPFWGWVYVVWPKGKPPRYLNRLQAEAYAKARGFVLPSEKMGQIKPLSQRPGDIFDRIERSPKTRLYHARAAINSGCFVLTVMTVVLIAFLGILRSMVKTPQSLNLSEEAIANHQLSVVFHSIPKLAVFDFSDRAFIAPDLILGAFVGFIYIWLAVEFIVALSLFWVFYDFSAISKEAKNESN